MTNLITKGVMTAGSEKQYLATRKMALHKFSWLKRAAKHEIEIPANFDAFTVRSFCDLESSELGFKKLAQNSFRTHLESLNRDSNQYVVTKKMLKQLRMESKGVFKPDLLLKDVESSKKKQRRLMAQNKALTDNLISLRIAFLRMVEVLEGLPVKDKHIQEQIRMGYETYGLTAVPQIGLELR